MSWIARADAAAALQFLVETTSLSGPVNVVAPNPVRNAEFTATLARVLRRPAIVVVPEFAVRLMYGQMGMESIVWGQRVDPGRLLAAGFRFGFPELEPALIEAVRRT
jgi:NAD dependent epimerase/dehydratase family enzyme